MAGRLRLAGLGAAAALLGCRVPPPDLSRDPAQLLEAVRGAQGRVARGFGTVKNPRFNTSTYNSGIDIAASFGASISAVAPGRVEYVNWIDGYGKCVILNHGGGYYTLYAHASEITVPVGKEVSAGETIGRVGDTGSTSGTVLHFEIRRGKEALNPLEWFR